MKSVHQKAEADAYITAGGLHLTKQYDRYTHTTETRTKIQKESSGDSGGSTYSESGGGGSGNQITIKASGNIKVDGQQVDVSGKSAVNVKASGQLNLEASGVTNVKGAMVKVN